MRKHFIHSGDLGDVLYSLPTVKAMGGGDLWLIDRPGVQTMHGMTRERFQAIRPLLAAQPYVSRIRSTGDVATISEADEWVDLNTFRFRNRDLCNEWLPNHYLDVHGVPRDAATEPWLTVEGDNHVPVVIARSARYHNPQFPWRNVVERYGEDNIAFLGTPAEHAAFNLAFGTHIDHVRTASLMDAARLIAACDLFIGNQSCPLAIAEGLKKPIVCEVCPYCPNCISPRADFIAGRDENVHLPDLERLLK